MIIREMKRSDVEKVVAIETKVFSQPWSREGFLEALSGESGFFLVALEKQDTDKNILGYIGMYASFEEGEITNVAVSPEKQGNGIGKALVDAMLAYAKSKQIERIILEVRKSNTTAIRLYERVGFHKIGTRKAFYQFPREDGDIMEWKEEG